MIKKAVSEFGFESWMFESSDPPVFKWYLKNFALNVNLFIDHSQIVDIYRLENKAVGRPGRYGKERHYLTNQKKNDIV